MVVPAGNVLAAVAVTVVFSAAARMLHGVTRSGAIAGAIVCFAMYMSAGPSAFAVLMCVFAIAVGTTRVGYARKMTLGAAESRQGRSASQVFANVGVAALASVLFGVTRNSIFLIAAAAALAEAAADTSSSEIGEAIDEQTRLITTFELVPPGTNGGITVSGTLAGAMASLLVTGCSTLVNLIPRSAFLLVGCAGFFGMLLDSILGAVLERRGALNNDTVNLLGTFSAALIALLLTRVLL